MEDLVWRGEEMKAMDRKKKKTKARKATSTQVAKKKAKPARLVAKAKKVIAKTSKNEKSNLEKTTPEKKTLPKNVKKAIESVSSNKVETSQEDRLQKHLEGEIRKELGHSSTLVKEDFSPANRNRDQLIVEYAPLIRYIAQKIASRLPANIELDDLISSGVIGLMDAIDKYDSNRDNKFKTYAEFRIRGAILDELRAQDWVPRSVREKAKQLERCYAKIEQEKGRQATEEEVCELLGLSKVEFHDMLAQVRSVSLLSYDDFSNFSKADKRSLHGFGEASNKAPTPFNEVSVAYLKKMIAEAIEDLPEKQRLVLSLYYYEDLNLKEIGKVLDVTESRVSQLHTQAVLRLKGRLKNHWDEFLGIIA